MNKPSKYLWKNKKDNGKIKQEQVVIKITNFIYCVQNFEISQQIGIDQQENKLVSQKSDWGTLTEGTKRKWPNRKLK